MSVNLGRIKSGPNYKPYVAFFILVSLAIIAFVIHTTFARATITLETKKDTTRGATNVNISPDATGNLTAFNAIKGQIIEKEIQTTKTFSGVEKKEIDAFAKGTITLVNNRSEDQPLVKGTQLASENGILFKTEQRAVVPANGNISVPIKAVEKGVTGNVPAGKFVIIKLWENWQDLIFGESSEPLSGGRVNDFVITQETLDKAQENIALQIAQDITQELSPSLENEIILPETIEVNFSDFKPRISLDDISDSFEVDVKAQAVAVSFNSQLIAEVAKEKIENQIKETKEITSLNTDDLSYTLKSINEDKRSAIIEVSIEAETNHKIPSKALEKNSLIGRNYGDVIAYYRQFDEVNSVHVSFFPFWVQNIPSSENNIFIEVK